MVSNVAYGDITLSKTNGYDYNPIVIDGLDFTPTHGLILPKISPTATGYSLLFFGVLPDSGGYYWESDGYGGGFIDHLTPYFNIATSNGKITFTPDRNGTTYRVIAGTYFYLTWREE